jgi:hypothetical protein
MYKTKLATKYNGDADAQNLFACVKYAIKIMKLFFLFEKVISITTSPKLIITCNSS